MVHLCPLCGKHRVEVLRWHTNARERPCHTQLTTTRPFSQRPCGRLEGSPCDLSHNPFSLQTDRQTPMKTLPSRMLCMRTVTISATSRRNVQNLNSGVSSSRFSRPVRLKCLKHLSTINEQKKTCHESSVAVHLHPPP